ncbi:hypothetical protein Csa_000556 [Cucumis sativus]|nr:hypothetical protein Csa_000556 [Cucumis sativus]
MDHYGAVVDLIGRASRIKEVSDCTQNMPIGLGITVCGATLDATSTTHPQFKRTYALNLGNEIKTASYVPDTNLINNVEGDVQEQLLNSHSKQLAVAFGHLNTSPGTTILVRKIRKGKTKGRSFRGHWN